MSRRTHFLPGGGGRGEWAWVFVRTHAGVDEALEESARGRTARLASVGSLAAERARFSVTQWEGEWGVQGLVARTTGSTRLPAVSEG